MNSTELRKKIEEIDIAISNYVNNDAISGYSLNSSQSQTSIKKASLTELQNLREYYQNKLNEAIALESGSNIVVIR